MSANDPRYAAVDTLWKTAAPVPPCTRIEAERAVKRLYRKFGSKKFGSPSMRVDAKPGRVRTCWISSKNGTLEKGWPRLAHDVSHRIFAKRYPSLQPHNNLHARLELEITEYIFAQGWLTGSPLLPAERPKASPPVELDAIDEKLKRWQTKAKRAATAIDKLTKQRRRLVAKELAK